MNQSIEKVSNLWSELQSNNRLPKGSLTTACEAELQELMRQIDIMVNTKKKEWERELSSAQACLVTKDKELMIQKSTLDQKHKEVDQLHQQLKEMDNSQRELVSQYESQITLLRKEVQKIKRDYDRLQRKHQRNSKDVERQKDKTSTDLQDGLLEINRLNSKLEECRQEARDWKIQKRTFQNQIENLEAQKKALIEKSDFMQNQSQSYQSQLDRRRQILDSSEFNLKTQITQLEGQLERANDIIAVQENKLDKLKETVDELTAAQRETTAEQGRQLEDLKRATQTIRNLEDEKSKLSADLRSKDGFLRLAEEDLKQNSRDLSQLEQTLSEKDEIIRSLGDMSRREEGDQFRLLRDQLQQAEDEVKSYRRSERKLGEELSRVKVQNEHVQRDYEDMCNQLARKTDELRSLEQTEIKTMTAEITKLQDKLSLLEGSHNSEFDGMRKELSALTTELHNRNTAVVMLNEETSNQKKQLEENFETSARKDAEIHVANTQLEALRLENRHLRHSALQQAQNVTEQNETQQQLKDLKDSFSVVITKLEDENQRLRDEIQNLKIVYEEALDKFDSELQSAQRQHNLSLQEITIREERKMMEVEKAAEQRINSIQQQLMLNKQMTVNDLGLLNHHNQQLEDQLEDQETSLKRVAVENEALSLFVEKIDDIVLKSPNQWDSILSTSGVSTVDTSLLTVRPSRGDHSFEGLSSRDNSFSERFLAEENVRALELEKLIDSHIENLKADTDAAIKKWVR